MPKANKSKLQTAMRERAYERLHDELYERLRELDKFQKALADHKEWLTTFAEFIFDENGHGETALTAMLAQAHIDLVAARVERQTAVSERDQMRQTLEGWAKEYRKGLEGL